MLSNYEITITSLDNPGWSINVSSPLFQTIKYQSLQKEDESDAKDSRALLALRSMGAHIAVGHSADNLLVDGQLPTTVVTSFAAIPQDNPELVAAKENGIPVIRRSDLLAALMTGSTQVLIAGTHGKTSTTSMAVVALQAAGMDPSFAIGGQLNKAGTNAHHGTGHCFVAEADESDASLLTYEPAIAVSSWRTPS